MYPVSDELCSVCAAPSVLRCSRRKLSVFNSYESALVDPCWSGPFSADDWTLYGYDISFAIDDTSSCIRLFCFFSDAVALDGAAEGAFGELYILGWSTHKAPIRSVIKGNMYVSNPMHC